MRAFTHQELTVRKYPMHALAGNGDNVVTVQFASETHKKKLRNNDDSENNDENKFINFTFTLHDKEANSNYKLHCFLAYVYF